MLSQNIWVTRYICRDEKIHIVLFPNPYCPKSFYYLFYRTLLNSMYSLLNWSQRTITKHLNISRCAVQNITKKVKERGTIKNLTKIGRPRMNSERTLKSLIRDAKINPKKASAGLLKDWISGQPTSISTMKNVLRKYNLFGCIAAKKPLLSVRNVRNMFQWCKCYAKVYPTFWNNVIFSGETRLELFSRRREYVRRPQGSRYNGKIYDKDCEIWRGKYHGLGRHKSR